MPVKLNGSTSGYTQLSAPAIAGNNTFTLPAVDGTIGQFIQTDGSGNLSFVTPTPGYSPAVGDIVTSISASKSGYLLCDGSAYTKTSYSALATAIGTPLSPVMTLGNSSTAATNGQIAEANGLLFKNGSVTTTTATAAGGVLTSTDGITWTSRTGMNVQASLANQNAAYGNSVYVVNSNYSGGGITTYYQTTPDGVTFTTRSISNGANTATNIAGFAFGGTSNRFVMVSGWATSSACVQTNNNVRLSYSTDGFTWSAGDTNTYTGSAYGFTAFDVAGYSGGFVSVAYLNNGTNYIKYSADGATWSDITSNVNSVAAINGIVRYVSYANGRFIIVTTNGQIYTSTTGASGTWSQIVSSSSIYTGRVRGNANAYVMALSTGSYVSTDLVNWTLIPNLGLGNVYITATPASGTRFYGTLVTGNNNAYYADLFTYNTSTQFVVPKLSTYATGGQSSPFYQNGAAVNYFIKT